MALASKRRQTGAVDATVARLIEAVAGWSEPTLREVVRSTAKALLKEVPELQDAETRRAIKVICEEVQGVL